ncbi:carboxymuconolactone decarboxylase family protein [Thalassobaculum sp.]|uniref:carboxymuconolactone decarboxylase family protein n=1 Tax=Thalassobaculum sp. TaxID=2022740 RepID=UPI0032EC8B25
MAEARIPLPDPDSMTPEQRAVYDTVVSGPRGAVIGPLRAALHSPELADRWQRLGEILRYRLTLPKRLGELAILVTARRWNAELEWVVHAEAALAAGLAPAVVEAILDGRPPRFSDPDEAEVYVFVRELQLSGRVGDPAYEAVRSRWGERGVVELTALTGYYTMVAMTLNAHRIPLPDGLAAAIHPDGEPLVPSLSGIPGVPA